MSRERNPRSRNDPSTDPAMTTTSLRSRLCVPLTAMFVVCTLAGCDDPTEAPADGANTDTDAVDTGGGVETEAEDAEDEDDASSTGNLGESDGDPPEDPPEDTPFEDDPEAALGALSGMGYVCYDAEETSFNLFFAGSDITARFADGTSSQGTYDTAGGTLTLTVPELGFTESATDAAVALDALVYFETPSLRCGAYYLDHTVPEGTDVIDCPTIKYVPETSWETNRFYFGDGGYVRRRRTTELPAVPDTLYSERLGVYRVVGNQMFIVLAFEDEGEQWLTGTITEEGLYIDQLEPERGACE